MNANRDQYDFILNPQQSKKPTGMQFQSGKKKILVFVGILAGLTIALVVGFSIITSLGKPNSQNLITIQAYQTEIDRVITLASKNIKDLSLKYRVATMQTVVGSDQKQINSLTTKRKVKITKLELAAKKDGDIDTALNAAKQDGTFDDVLLGVIESLSNDYYKALKTALTEASSKTEKELLQQAIDNIEKTAQ